MELGRLSKTKEIQRVLSKGKHIPLDLFRAKFYQNPQEKLKFAIIVSKKISKKAVERNRIKRRLRESLRKHQDHFQATGDLCLFPSLGLLSAPFGKIEKDTLRLAKKI